MVESVPQFSVPSLLPRDIAREHLECAVGLPGSEDLNIPTCIRWLDEAARLVACKTQRHFYQFEENPAEFNYSEGVFRMSWLATVLQRDLGVRYRMELNELSDQDFFSRSDHLFIHGIIQGKGGTCSSLPVLYAAVGRRLGYPLYLVNTKQHGFLRWDGYGQRFNIETTSHGFVSHPDEYYLKWPFETTQEEVRQYHLLRNETPAEERAGNFSRSGTVWWENKHYGNATVDYLCACREIQGREILYSCLCSAVSAWGGQMRAQIGEGFPGLVICQAPSRLPDLPENLTAEINYLNALEPILNDPVKKALWWGPLRRDPKRKPPGMPDWLQVTYLPPPSFGLRVEPCADPRHPRKPAAIPYSDPHQAMRALCWRHS